MILEITVPGSVAAGTWEGENLIGDYLNRDLLDRVDNVDEDLVEPGTQNSEAAYTIGGSDTSENANPFTDANGGNIGVTAAELEMGGGVIWEMLEACERK